jgi:hypothetical protein
MAGRFGPDIPYLLNFTSVLLLKRSTLVAQASKPADKFTKRKAGGKVYLLKIPLIKKKMSTEHCFVTPATEGNIFFSTK